MKSAKALARIITSWYRDNARNLPWRNTQDPYHIWASEVILQQTTVAQGEAYYNRFITKFPNIKALARAPLDEVLKIWEGLGYYSRARNMHAAAQDIMDRHAGIFPETYKDIIALKGIGPYAAAAIGSFAYGLPYVVVDGNVLRVMSRLYGIVEPVDISETKKRITALGQAMLETTDPAEFNQSIMEFGALCCTYKNPSCSSCPLSKSCRALADGNVSTLPLKSKKIKKRHRYFQFIIVIDAKGQVILEQRKEKDIWQGLYQFPVVETSQNQDAPRLHEILDIADNTISKMACSEIHKQTLTHQYISARFYSYRLAKAFTKQQKQGKIVVSKGELQDFAWPKIIANYLKTSEIMPS